MPAFDRVLVANRGEIACRIFRSLRELSMTSIAVFSEADEDSRHARSADVAVRIGPAAAVESYLSISRILEAAAETGAEAIHPGYGFLAENATFARAVVDAGLVWIGPPADAIDAMGDKISAKRLVSSAGVPVVPGRAEPGMTDDALVAAAREIGWPVLIKPSAGGGGKGMHVVAAEDELISALQRARREAAASFGDDTLFVERYLATPRHIEVQVLADTHGSVIHLGERECSLQRRHQKIIEEAPSPLLDEPTRARIGAAACETARSVGYVGAGTVEFIVSADAPDEFFFMEMNTRLQVEHPVTEMVTGIDLVVEQIRVAQGEVLAREQSGISFTGHAIEARIYAEDPAGGFLPTSGEVVLLRGDATRLADGIRVDSGIVEGQSVGTSYDPMLAKVIAHGDDRAIAIGRLDAALADLAVLGLTTNIGFLRQLLDLPVVRNGDLDTTIVDSLVVLEDPPTLTAFAAAVAPDLTSPTVGATPWDRRDGWRLGGSRAPLRWCFETAGGSFEVRATALGSGGSWEFQAADETATIELTDVKDGWAAITVDGTLHGAWIARIGNESWVHVDGATWRLTAATARRLRGGSTVISTGEIRSPMPGTVIAVSAGDGDAVEAGVAVFVVEAMKMEHTIVAPIAGVVDGVTVRLGDSVAKDQLLAVILTDPAG